MTSRRVRLPSGESGCHGRGGGRGDGHETCQHRRQGERTLYRPTLREPVVRYPRPRSQL